MHDSWTDKLSEYLDDELPPRERADVAAHLAACDTCRRTLDELTRIVEEARALTPRPPASDLWIGIAERLVSSRPVNETPAAVLDEGHSQATPLLPRMARRISFTLPQLAAASLLLAAVSGSLAWNLRTSDVSSRPATTTASPIADRATAPASGMDARDRIDLQPERIPAATPVTFADAQYDAAVADLEKALDKGRGRLDKSTIAVVERNLQIIDRAIAQARQALESDPANSYLSSHLVETRRKKLDLLRSAAALATESD